MAYRHSSLLCRGLSDMCEKDLHPPDVLGNTACMFSPTWLVLLWEWYPKDQEGPGFKAIWEKHTGRQQY